MRGEDEPLTKGFEGGCGSFCLLIYRVKPGWRRLAFGHEHDLDGRSQKVYISSPLPLLLFHVRPSLLTWQHMGNGPKQAKQQDINKPKTMAPDNELGFQVLPVIITSVESQHVNSNECIRTTLGGGGRECPPTFHTPKSKSNRGPSLTPGSPRCLNFLSNQGKVCKLLNSTTRRGCDVGRGREGRDGRSSTKAWAQACRKVYSSNTACLPWYGRACDRTETFLTRPMRFREGL